MSLSLSSTLLWYILRVTAADDCCGLAGYLFRNAQYRLELQRSMDDGEVAQLPASFFQEPALATAGLATASFWDGYAEGSQKTHVQVCASEQLLEGRRHRTSPAQGVYPDQCCGL